MKKPSCLLLLSILVAPFAYANNKQLTTNHTYFRVRPQFQVGSPERVSTHRKVHQRHGDENKHKFTATFLGGQSTKRSDLGTFFMPYGSDSVTVNGQITDGSQDLLTQHFNLFSVGYSNQITGMIPELGQLNGTPFKSTIKLRPQQSVVGLGLSYTYDEFCMYGKNHWFSVSAPLVRVKNRLGFSEDILEQGAFFEVDTLAGTNLSKELRSMKEAVVQNCWDFGKISQESLKETKLAFIQFQLGEHTYETDTAHFCPYIGVTAPTGNTPEAEFMFEPIVGHGNHAGLFLGSMAGYVLGESLCKNFIVHYETDTVLNYFFTKKQKRSIDLKYKPWSRYIEVYKNRAQAQQAFDLRNVNSLQSTFLASPGINELTFDMRVSPGFSFTSNHALLFDYDYCDTTITGEFGYNFYFHQQECVKPDNKFTTDAALKDHIGRGISNPVRNMTNDRFINEVGFCSIELDLNNLTDAFKNFTTSTITESDLDYNSAAHPCTVSHTVYATFSGQWENCLCPLDILIGGSYEFSGKQNTALDRWLLWANLGVNF